MKLKGTFVQIDYKAKRGSKASSLHSLLISLTILNQFEVDEADLD
jgi:hypothetical protein